MQHNANFYIETLQLLPHPEGGYYKELYRSDESLAQNALPERYVGNRNFCTSIYFLLKSHQFSAFHKILSDETWHFYTGSSLTLMMIDEAGLYKEHIIGNQLQHHQTLQYTVKRNTWFAAKVNESDSFTLLGCTVAPGFDFHDFQLASKSLMLQQFPQHIAVIEKYCI